MPCFAQDSSQPNLATLISNADNQRDSKVGKVRSVRQYTLRNSRWKSDATMEARMTTSADGSKRYEILNTNAEGMRKKILVRILDGEVEAAARKDRDGEINSTNYELRPLSAELASAQTCQMVELIPKRRTRFTFDGRGCVDMTDMAMVRIEGRTTKNLTFLVGRPYIVHEFRKVGEFWYSSVSHSTADVKFLGKTELIVKYTEYSITPPAPGAR
jgi:hypothetical protein